MPKINYCELKRIHIGSIKTHRCRLKLKNCKRIDHHLNQRVFQNRRCRETKHISMLEEWKKVCIYGVKFFPTSDVSLSISCYEFLSRLYKVMMSTHLITIMKSLNVLSF